MEASLEKADGEAGDAVKYKASLSQMAHRWQLFSALYGIEEEERASRGEPIVHSCLLGASIRTYIHLG